MILTIIAPELLSSNGKLIFVHGIDQNALVLSVSNIIRMGWVKS